MTRILEIINLPGSAKDFIGDKNATLNEFTLPFKQFISAIMPWG